MVKQVEEKVVLLANQQLSGDLWLATFKAPIISQLAEPGQFVLIEPAAQFFLKRPFSFFDINKTEQTVQIYYQSKGLGTWYMAQQWKIGQIVTMQGPHGQGFQIDEINDILIVAGGIGIAPMKCLIDQLEKTEKKYQVIFGGQNQAALTVAAMFSQLQKLILVTDDGSIGKQQNVIEALKEYLQQHKPKVIIGCGPSVVLNQIAKLGEQNNISTQLSYESRMGCGVGACMGCTIIKDNTSYKLCIDGPVIINKYIEQEGE
ncbi:iron-sulfur cluster-binding protein [Spiroplasma chrysopicola]|uniref:Dihydroorotate dehydrogenase electron transfer subunit n=1 Tax=Spiroplasma chrysopicola DF-1 TaxID=1276227 RepID=R4U0N7_9MOLU|nr:dihydroorotate dehydrogenase [Spiroplasma chrysopicola]AGM24832.1 dihydroorotate dehydrogenase electron transfer subunit [Spiroplasma chrysopicola DF-1]